MAYQFADGFDNYGNSYVMTAGYPWDTVVGTCTTSTGTVRFAAPGSLPGGSLGVPGGSSVRKNLSSSQATLVFGMGFITNGLPATNPTFIFDCWDTGTSQVSLGLAANGSLQFYRGTTNLSVGTAIGTASASGTITSNTWYGFAVQITFNGTTGSVALYLNGSATALINSTGLNTIATANASANQISLGAQQGAGGLTYHYDDFYCLDTTGVTLNALLGGDARILTKMPSGAGNYTNWTPNGLGSNFSNAAVLPPSTSDYNANNTATTKDSYAMQSASLTVAPYFVVARASLTRDDAGPHTPSIFVRSSSTDSSGVVTAALTSGYLFYDGVFVNDPNTGSPWTGAAADAAQVGIIEG